MTNSIFKSSALALFCLTLTASMSADPVLPPVPDQAVLESDLLEVRQLEAELDRLMGSGLQYEQIWEARQALPSAMNGDASALARLTQTAQLMGDFQTVYDQYTIRAVSFILDYSYLTLSLTLEDLQLRPHLSVRLRRQFERLLADVRTNYQKYLDAKAAGEPLRDPKARFNSAGKGFFKAIEQLDLFIQHHGENTLFEVNRRTGLPAMPEFRKTLAMLMGLPIVWNVVFPQSENDEQPGRLSLSRAAQWTTRAAARSLGFSVEVDHRERMTEALADRGTITLIAPNHTHAYADLMAMSQLIQDDTIIVSALHAIMNWDPFLIRAYRHPQIIGVGSSRVNPMSPIEKAIEVLRRGTSNNILIYAQGKLDAGLLGAGPAADRFGVGFVKGLMDAGYRVQILPVVYTNSGTPLLDDFRMLAPGDRTLRVDVLNPITPEEVRFLLEYDPSGQTFNRVLRQHWLSNLQTDSRFIGGQMRIDHALRELSFLTPVLLQESGLMRCEFRFKTPGETGQ